MKNDFFTFQIWRLCWLNPIKKFMEDDGRATLAFNEGWDYVYLLFGFYWAVRED